MAKPKIPNVERPFPAGAVKTTEGPMPDPTSEVQGKSPIMELQYMNKDIEKTFKKFQIKNVSLTTPIKLTSNEAFLPAENYTCELLMLGGVPCLKVFDIRKKMTKFTTAYNIVYFEAV